LFLVKYYHYTEALSSSSKKYSVFNIFSGNILKYSENKWGSYLKMLISAFNITSDKWRSMLYPLFHEFAVLLMLKSLGV